MKGRALALIAVLAMGATASAQERAPLSTALQTIRDARQVPALGALVSRQGRIIEESVVGIRKQGDPTPVAVTDPFHLGSDTKAMTATLVAMLVDDGTLSWTSTLHQLLPELTTMDPGYADVTLDMLLAHRAGLGAEGDFDGGRLFGRLEAPGLDPVAGRQMVAREMLSAPPEIVPGSAFRYSNAGYIIAGHIVERVTGRSWESLMRARLFEPLAMASCGFGALDGSRPWGHERTGQGLIAVDADNPSTLGPAGTVHCSMQDWMKFVQLHLDAFNGHPRLASAAAFEKLHTSYPGQVYTYGGWGRLERPWAGGVVFTHDGSNTLNYASVWWAPTMDSAVLAVSNAGPPAGQVAVQEAVGAALRSAGLLP